MKLRKAVFPVAGFGTRFLPATKAMPKELLPIVDKPLIQYAAEEAIAAGIDTLIFVTGRNKRAIEDHFDANNELETILRAKGRDAQAEMVRNIIPEGVECIFVRQAEQLGLGHAVLCAERAVGDDPFAVLLAAGLKGIEEGYELPPEAEDDVWSLTDTERRAAGYEDLPVSLGEALGAMEGSELVAETLGEQGVHVVLQEFPDALHGFVSLPGVSPAATQAVDATARFLRDVL